MPASRLALDAGNRIYLF